MDLKSYLDLSFKVLLDWRVILCAAAVFVSWALLRYVGVIVQRRPRSYPSPRPPQSGPRPEAGED